MTRVTLALVAIAAACASACGAATTTTSSSMSPHSRASASTLPSVMTGPGGCSVKLPKPSERDDTGVAFLVCYSASGGLTASGGFFAQDPARSSCGDWAARGQQTSVIGIATSDRVEQTRSLPSPGSRASEAVIVDGGELDPGLSVGPYSGPGTFTRSDVSQGVALRDHASLQTLHSWDDIGVHDLQFGVTVNADGSGSAAVNGLVDNSHGGTTLNYTERWRCLTNTG